MDTLRLKIIIGLTLIPSPLLHADNEIANPIGQYINRSTALIAWIDVNNTDFEALRAFAKTYEVQTGSMTSAKKFQQALKTLDVERAFILGSLQELTSGQPVVVLPSTAENIDTVELVATATFEDHPLAIRKDGTNVLIGAEASLAKYVSQSADKVPSLLAAISEAKHPSGAILRVPAVHAVMLSPLLPDLLQGLEATVEETASISKGVMSLKTVALSSSIPPVAGSLRITLNSDDDAKEFAETIGGLIRKTAPKLAHGLELTTDGATVIHEANNAKQMTATMDCLSQLLSPARLSAKQTQDLNSLKQIGLAMHNFYDVHKHFPPHALSSYDGQKLLSWRVLILPYLGEVELYKKFRLNEPWDSAHNIKLVDEIPFAYSGIAPTETASDGETRMQTPLHPKSVFGRTGGGATFQEMVDGSSNTIMVVQVPKSKAVIWSKPDDLEIAGTDIKSLLIAKDSDGFLMCLCDGFAGKLSSKNTNETLMKLITMNGGEIVGELE